MKLSVRVINTLEDNGVILAGQLMTQTYESLMRMRNFGDTTLREVKTALDRLGLKPPNWTKPPKPKAPPRPRGRGKLYEELW